ncbi:MAG: TetR/AcrR family transcriptional regulator [Oscillospiraceae bacterium]|nr:TetR/AcrR family transcriptional regulator [Oscillospiraceae bacterium]
MKKFLSLPQEKQDRIVTAAMNLFGEAGYKKAYISEIAAAAGISKALIFHYFGSKKGLYSYLVYYTGKIIMTEAQHDRDTAGFGFYERVLITIRFRLSLKKRYPAMNAFIESVFNEDSDEVISDIERLLAIAKDMHAGICLAAGEEGIFKAGINPEQVIAVMSKFAEGVVHTFDGNGDIEKTIFETEKCINMLKSVL